MRSVQSDLGRCWDLYVVTRASSSEHFTPKLDIWSQCRLLFFSRAPTCSSTILVWPLSERVFFVVSVGLWHQFSDDALLKYSVPRQNVLPSHMRHRIYQGERRQKVLTSHMCHRLYQGERRPSECERRRVEKLLLGKHHGARCKPCMH